MSILKNIGARLGASGTAEFTVWAPFAQAVSIEITAPNKQLLPLQKKEYGYWQGSLQNTSPETRYFFLLDGKTRRPDPASHFQPGGVHKASGIVDHHAFPWSDQTWPGIPLKDLIIYELHTGTFTEQGTFEGIISRLDYLVELGINAIEIMPVAQFPGNRNWGYDGVYPFAVQDSYGGPEGLKKLVNACHQKGIAVVLDVVYNHLGPEGNYLNDFGPYFTDKYKTPWGSALNFDDAQADGVRNFFIQNALLWFSDYHIDALRLDAVHAIMDLSARHFLQELADEVKQLEQETGRNYLLIAESDLNDVRLINAKEKGGYGLHAQWNDDFHHALHALVTGERAGYYADFGHLKDLEKAYSQAFVFNGNYAPHRQKSYGNSAAGNSGEQFVVCAQNHDQVGNRMPGDRLAETLGLPALKLVAAAYLLSPYLPMLFMGEEYGEKNPFQYFISHTDEELVKAVQKGRREEFKAFKYEGEVPDPQSEKTFRNSRLSWQYQQGAGKELYEFYRQVIALRKRHPVFSQPDKNNLATQAFPEKNVLVLERWQAASRVKMYLNFSAENQEMPTDDPAAWRVLLASSPTGEPAVSEKLLLPSWQVLVLEKQE